MIHIYSNPFIKMHEDCTTAFATGCINLNLPYKTMNIKQGYQPSEYACLFGYSKKNGPGNIRRKIVESHKDKSKLIIIERGYIFRDEYFSVGLGHFNGRADFKNLRSDDARWTQIASKLDSRHIPLGENVLICGQVPHDASVEHIDFQEWVFQTCQRIYDITQRPIVFRPHPLSKTKIRVPSYINISNQSIENDLKDCGIVVTFNSNLGVDATLMRRPVYAFDKGSMVKNLSHNNIDDIDIVKFPQLEFQQWCNNICYTQWNLKEISQGLPHKHLGILDEYSK